MCVVSNAANAKTKREQKMKIEQILENTEIAENRQMQIASEIAAEASARATRYGNEFAKLRTYLPGFVQRLAKLGLQVETCRVRKTGHSDSWIPGDRLAADITATPTSETSFKFYSWKGYTAQGASVNQPQRNAKAQKMDALLSAEGLTVSVNASCLEDSRDRKQSRVLMSLWMVKPAVAN